MPSTRASRFRLTTAAALLAVGLAAPAWARGPYYLSLLGRDADSGSRASGGPGGGWIEISSVGHGGTGAAQGTAPPPPPPPSPRPRPGSTTPNDLTGDSFPDLLTKVGPGRLILSGALANCHAGDRYREARLREGANGRVVHLEGVTIASCAGGSFTLNYSGVRH